MVTPMNFKIKTENIRNSRPATAAIIMSRPPISFCWSPEEVKTRTEPMTIRIKARPPAMPVARERILVAKAEGLVGMLPRAVWQFPPGQGLVPDARFLSITAEMLMVASVMIILPSQLAPLWFPRPSHTLTIAVGLLADVGIVKAPPVESLVLRISPETQLRLSAALPST